MLAATVAAPACAYQNRDQTAPATRTEPSAKGWDVHARELMSQGELVAAEILLDARLVTDPKDVQARFLKGMILVAKGDNRQAVRIFRAILIDHPGATRVRLELARAFYLEKDYGNALRQFQFSLAGDPPPEVVANIGRYIASIRDAKSLSYNIGISVAPDSNLNTGSSLREVSLFGLPFDLSDEARQRSGIGVALDAGGEWAPRIATGKRLRLGANVQRREYSGSDFDDMTMAGYAGPRIVTGKWDLSLLGTAYERWYGARAYSGALGLRAEATHYPGPGLAISGALTAQRIVYYQASGRSGSLFSLNAAGFKAVTSSSGVTLKAGASRQKARFAPYSSWSSYVAAGYFKDLPVGFSAYVEPSLSIACYDATLPGFERKRADTTGSLLVTLLNRKLVLSRFTPRISYTFTKQNSSVSLYDFTRHRLEIGLTTVF